MEQLVTVKEAAELIGVSAATVRSWMRRGTDPLPSIQVGATGSHRRIVSSQISAWLEAEASRDAGLKK